MFVSIPTCNFETSDDETINLTTKTEAKDDHDTIDDAIKRHSNRVADLEEDINVHTK